MLNGPKKINAIGAARPGLVYGGCHGDDERAVFDHLCQIVEEAVEIYQKDGKPLPPATSTVELASQ